MKLSQFFRRVCGVTSLMCGLSLPAFSQAASGNINVKNDSQVTVGQPTRSLMFGFSNFMVLGAQYDIQKRISPHWSVGPQLTQVANIFVSNTVSNLSTYEFYNISARYYWQHEFSDNGAYVSPTVVFLSRDLRSKTYSFMSTYDLSAGYQLQIGHRVGINASAGLLANVFGRVDKDERRFTPTFSFGVDAYI